MENAQDIKAVKQFVNGVFSEIRTALADFSRERDFHLTNGQLFTFLSFVPNAFAVASDGRVDEEELKVLDGLSRSIKVEVFVNLDLEEMLTLAAEPDNCILNEEFNIRAGAELLYLCRNLGRYEEAFVVALKAFLKFDRDPKEPASLTNSFVSMMNTMVEKNVSLNKEAEKANLAAFQKRLGLVA